MQPTMSFLLSSTISPMFQKKLNFLPSQNLSLGKLTGLVLSAKKSLDSGYVKLELLNDFLHKTYQEKYTKAVAEFSKDWADTELALPKEPYTPQIKSISLDYRASTSEVDLSLSGEKDYANKEVELFHMGAFGQREVHGYLHEENSFESDNRILLLPDYQNEGELYIGIKDIDPLQSINLLIQVAEGSANPETDQQDIAWELLVNDQWMTLDDDHLLADNTNGLLQSGIVKIYLPKNAATDNNWLTNGLTWIKAAITTQVDAVCKVVDIHAQAALAVFEDQKNSADHLATPLAAKTISKLKAPIAAIKSVSQPYASFDGMMEETSTAYYTRVSERLRHKNRAVTIWDYERLILDSFPNIHKVKCLNHTSDTSERAPGHVSLILIPDLTNQNAVDKLEPKVSKATLANTKSFVEELSPGLIEIHTSNPDYEEIKLDFQVRFRKNYEFGYYKDQLNSDIIDFLSPWATGKSTDISFGGKMHKSVILKFVEDREYVDFITEFKMYHLIKDGDPEVDVGVISAASSRAILVSDSQHNIQNYQEV